LKEILLFVKGRDEDKSDEKEGDYRKKQDHDKG